MQKAHPSPLHFDTVDPLRDALIFSAAMAMVFAAAVIVSILVPWN